MLIRLSSKGQIVIPRLIRKQLHLKRGDQLRAHVQEGKIVIEPIEMDAIDRLHGILAGTNVLDELEEEHRQEVENDRNLFT
ncbi:MAG: AbrB/MazE/SpoVT family DNA-binding domain-containing protein [Chloroflexi bacterium]|nr:AbrB/MazE/SpoVT family DNA-binding domain-containing protein [Chloroflexota bacterium]